MIYNNFCQWLDSNRRPLLSEATALPTQPQPLPIEIKTYFKHKNIVPVWPDSFVAAASVTRKKSPNVYKKLPKNDLAWKMKAIDTFTKIAIKREQFGQNNCCQMLWKVAQSSINCPIWSH